MSIPMVTVLMPAFNAEKYIREAIESVLVQTFSDFELLIVNDGSTDNTGKIIRDFNDTRISCIEQPNAGIAHALNIGLARARGKYIARFDADDICFPQRLEKQVRFLEEHPDYVLTGSDAEYLLENGEHLFNFSCIAHSHAEIMQKLYFYCPFIHSAVMYRKEAVAKAGGYPVHAHNFEDYLLWTQIVNYGKLYNLPERLIQVRFNPGSVTIDEKWRGPHFRELRRSIIRSGSVTEKEGAALLAIIKKQDIRKFKEGAYHALCAKKFLTDNYQPARSRGHVSKAIRLNPFRWDNYALYLVSFFPAGFIRWLHHKSPNKL
jgi:glycosyltransferase involved in cell wall biosynthesis